MPRIVRTKALQAFKEGPDDCDKKCPNAMDFHLFLRVILKLFPPECNDHANSDFLLLTLLYRLVNQNNLLNISNDQRNDTDAKTIKKN